MTPYRKTDPVSGPRTEHPLIAKPFDEALAGATKWWPLSPLILRDWGHFCEEVSLFSLLIGVLLGIASASLGVKPGPDPGIHWIILTFTVTISWLIPLKAYKSLTNGRLQTGFRRLNAEFKTKATERVEREISDIVQKRAAPSVELLARVSQRLAGAVSSASSKQIDEALAARMVGPCGTLFDLVGPLRTKNAYVLDPKKHREPALSFGIRNKSFIVDYTDSGTAHTQIHLVRTLHQQYTSMVLRNRQNGHLPTSNDLAEEETIRKELQIATAKLHELRDQSETALENLLAASSGS